MIFRPLRGLLFDLSGGVFRTDGCEFEIPKKLTSLFYRATFLDGDYEREERALIQRFLKPEDRVLECGACMGIVSCTTNRLLKDRTAHVILEGNPLLIPTLHANRRRNGCGFLIESAAVSNEARVTFYLHPVYIVGGTAQRKSEVEVVVPGRSLADLETRYGPFTTLVMDVEGSEYDVLQGCETLLAKYRLVVIELHPWAIGEEKVEACRAILRAAGLEKVGEEGLTEAWQRP
jgi:FkbM family methyltransferase